MSAHQPPVHDSLEVVNHEDIYRTEEWWKSVVKYLYEGAETPELAVYLWHRDDDWTRKNKYVIKTAEAWEADRSAIESLLAGELDESETESFPVSDYYTVGSGTTVFQSDGWWKAIVKVVEKGSYETEEVMVYLWQERDGDWRRRQKYTIKSKEEWQTESEAISSLLESQGEHETTTSYEEQKKATASVEGGETSSDGDVVSEFDSLKSELEVHLSETDRD